MIGYIDIEVQAERPECPLAPVRAFVGSPSSFRVKNVPKKIGDWNLTKVYVSANYPDNQLVSKECKPVGGVYVATLPACSVVGVSALGFSVTADGVDESGTAVTGYVLGKGELEILAADGTVTPGVTTHYIHVLPAAPTDPQEFDCYCDSGTWKIYNGSAWITLGGVSAGNAYVQSPTSEGGDGLWHRMLIVDGAIAFESEGVAEPPLAADKPWVTAAVAAEATARQAADTANANAITAEESARQAAVAAEATARQAADTANANAITAEATARQAAVAAVTDAVTDEAAARAAADATNANAIVAEAARAAAVEATKVSVSGTEAINGVKTFTSSPNVPTVASTDDDSTKAANTSWIKAKLAAWWNVIKATVVLKTGDESVAGVKTFTVSPLVPTVASTDDNSAKAASTAWVVAKLSAWWDAIKGTVTFSKSQVGLGNVDNTSDANKPISTAVQNALAAKAADDAVVKLTGDQTIAGVKTFSNRLASKNHISAENSYASFYGVATNLTNDLLPTTGRVAYKPLIATFSEAPTAQRFFIEIGRNTDGSTDLRIGFHSHLTSDSDDIYNQFILNNNRTQNKRIMSYNGDVVRGPSFAAVGMPSESALTNVIQFENGASYVAECSGWLVLAAYTNSDSGGYMRLYGENGVGTSDRANSNGVILQVMCPAKKGQTIILYCNNITTGSYSVNRFIKADAEVS